MSGTPRGKLAAADAALVGLAFELSLTLGVVPMTPMQRMVAMASCIGFDTLAGNLATLAASDRPLDDATRSQLHLYIFTTRQRAFEFRLHRAAACA